MLQRSFTALDPASVMQMWPSINSHILFALPPLSNVGQWTEERVLAAINRGELTLWLYSEGPRILAIITTTMTGDTITGERAMLIYSAHSDGGLQLADWQTMVGKLGEAARAGGMSRLVAYSDVDRVINLVQELGGKAAVRMCELPMPEES